MSVPEPHWTQLDEDKKKECQKLCADFNLHLCDLCDCKILVNVSTQRLHLIKSNKLICSYIISTGANGVGQKEGSGQTPLGLHVIASKFGDTASPFAVFKSRVVTGEIAKPNAGDDLILGRILWLKGKQPGYNQGGDVDSHGRYIYIHGTNDIIRLGRPASAGCVRMHPVNVVELFATISVETPVLIYTSYSNSR